jgi:NAD(P)-dependent dehydrogenase (short-subunit alcohol dehydrogenase family)
MRLKGKSTIVTGAGSGIGRATAVLFAQEGAHVFCLDINVAGARETVQIIAGSEGHGMAAEVNVTSSQEVQESIVTCVRTTGGIDILCNIAGIGSTQDIINTSEEVWDEVFAVNCRGTFLFCKYVLPHMIQRGGGVIVNMSSVAGLVGLKNRAAYCAAKGAIISLTKAIAIDHVAERIRCNCICPGTVDSPWVGRLLSAAPDPDRERASLVARQPMGRLGTPADIAQSALYLASDSGAFITGTALIIDGGLTAQ